jgi:hypothetical protein
MSPAEVPQYVRLIRHAHDSELAGSLDWKDSKTDGVDQLHDRGVCPDPERQRDQGNRRESRAAPEQPSAVPKILNHVVDDADAARIPAFLLRLLDAAEPAQRRAARLIRRHAAGDIRLGLPGEVILDLVVEIAVDAAAPEERSQPERKGVDPAFESHGSGLFDLDDL